jgi:hypothetical protein
MAIDPRQAIMQMMMQQGGGGGMPQGIPMPPQGMPPGAGAGLPPEIMALAAQGIRPGDMGMPMPQEMPASMPQTGAASDEEPMPDAQMPPEPRDPDPGVQGKYDPRFGPLEDKSREETEGELESVRHSMSERSLQAIEDDIREAAETGDTSAIEVLLAEMEEQGYEVAELPPDVQKMINEQDERDVTDRDRETEEPEED